MHIFETFSKFQIYYLFNLVKFVLVMESLVCENRALFFVHRPETRFSDYSQERGSSELSEPLVYRIFSYSPVRVDSDF